MSDNRSLDNLFKLVHALKRNLHCEIEALDLDIAPMNVRVLKIITHKPMCTAVDIANLLDRDKAQVTRLLSSLIKQGLVAKEANPEDKRSQCLRITQEGKAIMSKLSKIEKSIFQKMAEDIEPDDLENFERIARTMASNLSR